MKRIIGMVLVLVMVLSVFAGCSKPAPAPAPENKNAAGATEAPKGIQKGTVLKMYANMDLVTQQFPGQVPPAEWMYSYIYDTLFYAVNGDNNNMKGLLAKDWKTSDDALTWVINLQENVTFRNGTKLTADSVVGTYAFTRKFQEAVFASIESITATGEYQVTFKLKNPMPEFMRQFAVAHMGIIDYTQVKKLGENLEGAKNIGSGPYYIDSYKPGDFMLFKANEKYWREDRMPKIETINCKIIMDPNTVATALASGELDFGNIGDFNTYETLKGNKKLNILEGIGPNRTLYLNVNANPILKNTNVRKALSMMIDMKQVNLAATGGYGKVLTNAFNEAFKYDDKHVYDPKAGLALLEKEGVKPADIKLTALVDMTTSNLYNNLQAQFNNVGIKLNYSVQDIPAVMTLGIKGQWDIWSEHGGMTTFDYISPVNMMLGERSVFKMFNNPETNPKIWESVKKAANAKTYEEEKANLEQVLTLLGENNAYIGNVKMPGWNVFSSKVKGIVTSNNKGFFLPWYAYIAQ